MATQDSARGTLLIVEDEIDLLEILVEMLSPFCAKIITVRTGKEALAVLSKDEPVHAVLSDINMPQMTGFQLLAQLRSSGNIVPFITLTAYGDQENMRESIRLNATDFLTKPFDRKELSEVVSKALQQGLEIKRLEAEFFKIARNAHVSQNIIETCQQIRNQIMSLRIANSKNVKNSPLK